MLHVIIKQKCTSRKFPIPGSICTVFVKSEDCLIENFGMEGEVEMAFFLIFFFFYFLLPWTQRAEKKLLLWGSSDGEFLLRHLQAHLGSGWFGFLLQCGVLLANLFSSYMVLPGIGGWISSFAEQPLPCCYFLLFYYLFSVNNCEKSLKQLRAVWTLWTGMVWIFVHHWMKKIKAKTKSVQLR